MDDLAYKFHESKPPLINKGSRNQPVVGLSVTQTKFYVRISRQQELICNKPYKTNALSHGRSAEIAVSRATLHAVQHANKTPCGLRTYTCCYAAWMLIHDVQCAQHNHHSLYSLFSTRDPALARYCAGACSRLLTPAHV
eukprot:1928100-Pleurochrysis_carterae.AAC.1